MDTRDREIWKYSEAILIRFIFKIINWTFNMKLLNGLFSITFLAVTLDLNSCSQRLNTHKSSGSEGSANFISQCIDLANLGIGLQCSGIVCKGEEGATLSLEQLQVVECEENSDCRVEDTGMECVKGRCDCPPLLAFNVTSCSCQQAARCMQGEEEEEEEEESCPEHNGRKCEDRYCSCYSSIDYATLLVDPSSLFCLLPSDQIYPVSPRGSGAGSLGLAVLGALIGFVCVVAGAALVMGAYKHCVCQKVGQNLCWDSFKPKLLPRVYINVMLLQTYLRTT
jgi:hypothetical protein